MTMKLSVLERMLAVNMLPKEGSITNLKLIREAREALSFNEMENKLLQFKQEENQVRWRDTIVVNKETGTPIEDNDEAFLDANLHPENYEARPAVGEVEIKIGGVASGMIVAALKKLEENAVKKEKGEKVEGDCLGEQHISLYEKFVT